MIIRGQFSQFYGTAMLPALRRIIHNQYRQVQPVFSRLFDVRESDKMIEQATGFTGVGLLSELGEGEAVGTDMPNQTFPQTFTHRKWGLGIPTTQEMVEDDQFNLVARFHQSLARATSETRDILAASVLNNGTSGTGPDGVSLFNSAHPYEKVGGTWYNTAPVAADLDYLSLQLALTEFRLMKSPEGFFHDVSADILLAPPQYEFKALELLSSTDRPDTSNRAKSVVNMGKDGRLELMIWNKLEDPDSWSLWSRNNGLVWYNRRKPYTKSWTDDSREVGTTAIRFRASFGYEHPRGVMYNPGA